MLAGGRPAEALFLRTADQRAVAPDEVVEVERARVDADVAQTAAEVTARHGEGGGQAGHPAQLERPGEVEQAVTALRDVSTPRGTHAGHSHSLPGGRHGRLGMGKAAGRPATPPSWSGPVRSSRR